MKWSKIFKIIGLDKGFLNVTGANIISGIIMSLFWLFIASIMIPEEYGNLNFLLSIATFASVLSMFGLRITVMTYLSKGEESIHKQANLLVLFSNCIIFIPLLIIIQSIPVAFLFLGISFFNMSLAEMLGRRRHKKFFLLMIGSRVILVSVAIVLFFVMGIEGIIWGYAIATLLFSYNFFRSLKNLKFQFNALKAKSQFIINSYFVASFTRGSDHLDKIIIGAFFGFELLGLYQLSFQFLTLLVILPVSLSQFLIPQESAALKPKKTVKIGLTLSIIFAISSYFIIPMVITSFFSNFVEAIPAAQIIILCLIPITISAILKSKFWGQERSKPVVVSSALRLAVLLGLLILLGNYIGLIGFSIALLISEISQAIILYMVFKTSRNKFL